MPARTATPRAVSIRFMEDYVTTGHPPCDPRKRTRVTVRAQGRIRLSETLKRRYGECAGGKLHPEEHRAGRTIGATLWRCGLWDVCNENAWYVGRGTAGNCITA